MKQHIASIQTYVYVFAALLLLLFATLCAAYLPLHPFHFAVAMLIAVSKALLIVWFFMHLRHGYRVAGIFAVASFLWLGIMLALTLNDYLTRGWLDIPGK
jgi:cytochrome c oxidase subunit 4